MSYLSGPERERIRKLVAAADVESLLDLSIQAGIPAAQGHRQAFQAAKEAFDHGRITWEDMLQVQMRIFQDILQETGPTKPQLLFCPTRETVEQLVIQHRTEEALRLCEPLGDATLLLQAKYALLHQAKNTGHAEPAEWELAMSRLYYAVMELAEQLPCATEATTRSSCFARLRRFFARRLFR